MIGNAIRRSDFNESGLLLKSSIYEWVGVLCSSYEGDPLSSQKGEAAKGEPTP
jgi:hypothetical protein